MTVVNANEEVELASAAADTTEAGVGGQLPSTGERFIPGLGGMIELEHLHRYLFASQACRGRDVLDIACGEGYGSSMLAQGARAVIGVDISDEAVAHARKRYSTSNLAFKVGDCAAIPMKDASVDVVVSFETIEHHDRHEEMMREIRRVLRPGGTLILSSPERFEYSERPGTTNEFHVHELYRHEFVELVGRYFPNVEIYDQKVVFGSAIVSEEQATRAVGVHANSLHERSRGLVRPPYLIAVASDVAVAPFDTGVFEQELAESSEWKWWIATLAERDARIHQLDTKVGELDGQVARARQEAQRFADADAALVARTSELEAALAARTTGYQSALAARDASNDAVARTTAQAETLSTRVTDLESELLARTTEAMSLAAQRDEAVRHHHQALADLVQAQRRLLEAQADDASRHSVLEGRLSVEKAAHATLRQRLADASGEVARQTSGLAAALELVAGLEGEREWLRGLCADLEQKRAMSASRIAHLDAELDALHHYTAKVQWVLSTTQHALEKSEGRRADLERSLQASREREDSLRRSTSWRVTEPLREVGTLLRAIKRLPRRIARRGLRSAQGGYRRLPGNGGAKSFVKDKFFGTFGGVLAGTALHRDWTEFQRARHEQAADRPASGASAFPSADDAYDRSPIEPIPQGGAGADRSAGPDAPVPIPDVVEDLPGEEPAAELIPQLAASVTVMTEPATLAPVYSAAGAPLWVADGQREWADLPLMRDKIERYQRAHRQAVVPQAVTMASVDPQDVRTVAASLRFTAYEAPKVTILVPVFNQIALTLECLTSIVEARSGVTFEVLVADDASTDESAEVLALVPNIKLHRNAENLHFLRNCNASLALAAGDYVVFLNNDVQVQDWWLDEMVLAFERYERVGAVGPKILYPSGHLQEAGVAFNTDMTVDMIGLDDDPSLPRYNYARRVDYCSGACLMVPAPLLAELGGFCEDFVPAYCEDGDLCLRIRERGLFVYYVPDATVVHRLSATTAAESLDAKRRLVANNLVTFSNKWQQRVEEQAAVRTIAFYLPQFYPFAENDRWWGKGFTEWTNVTKAQPNFVGHYQPHLPADLGYYDLRMAQTMKDQARLAQRYGLGGFCFYYYWFAGKRLLDVPLEAMLASGEPAFPFCLCWANENWTRRWDGQESQILMAQSHTDRDDEAVIKDLIRYFRSPHYIRIDGRPLLVIYRVTLFPDFARTAAHWREVCRAEGIGEIYLTMVESFELVAADIHPSQYGCDATVEFPPQGLAEAIPPSGPLINPDFVGTSVDYRALALRYCNRPLPGYPRFRGAMPGWDNTPRRQNNSYCIEHATPGAFQAWLEHIVDDTRRQHFGDERIVFINAWNEWAEGAHLEPDRRFGHTYLEALRNAHDRQSLMRTHRYAM